MWKAAAADDSGPGGGESAAAAAGVAPATEASGAADMRGSRATSQLNDRTRSTTYDASSLFIAMQRKQSDLPLLDDDERALEYGREWRHSLRMVAVAPNSTLQYYVLGAARPATGWN